MEIAPPELLTTLELLNDTPAALATPRPSPRNVMPPLPASRVPAFRLMPLPVLLLAKPVPLGSPAKVMLPLLLVIAAEVNVTLPPPAATPCRFAFNVTSIACPVEAMDDPALSATLRCASNFTAPGAPPIKLMGVFAASVMSLFAPVVLIATLPEEITPLIVPGLQNVLVTLPIVRLLAWE